MQSIKWNYESFRSESKIYEIQIFWRLPVNNVVMRVSRIALCVCVCSFLFLFTSSKSTENTTQFHWFFFSLFTYIFHGFMDSWIWDMDIWMLGIIFFYLCSHINIFAWYHTDAGAGTGAGATVQCLMFTALQIYLYILVLWSLWFFFFFFFLRFAEAATKVKINNAKWNYREYYICCAGFVFLFLCFFSLRKVFPRNGYEPSKSRIFARLFVQLCIHFSFIVNIEDEQRTFRIQPQNIWNISYFFFLSVSFRNLMLEKRKPFHSIYEWNKILEISSLFFSFFFVFVFNFIML